MFNLNLNDVLKCKLIFSLVLDILGLWAWLGCLCCNLQDGLSLTKYYYIVLQSHIQIFPFLNQLTTRMGFLLCALRSYAAAQQINPCAFFRLTPWLWPLLKKSWGQRGQERSSEHTHWTTVCQYREILYFFKLVQETSLPVPQCFSEQDSHMVQTTYLPFWYNCSAVSQNSHTISWICPTQSPVRLLHPSSNHLFLPPWRYIVILQKVRLKDLNRLPYQK